MIFGIFNVIIEHDNTLGCLNTIFADFTPFNQFYHISYLVINDSNTYGIVLRMPLSEIVYNKTIS